MAHDVAVVGLTILDILGCPIDRIPEGSNVEFIEEIRLTVAGTAGGTMVDCAKLGLRTMAVAAVGHDEKGDFVIDTLNRFGVDTSLVQRTNAAPTSATMLTIGSSKLWIWPMSNNVGKPTDCLCCCWARGVAILGDSK